MSDSVQPLRWQPTRLLCPWDSPDKNTGVGCHFLLRMKTLGTSFLLMRWPWGHSLIAACHHKEQAMTRSLEFSTSPNPYFSGEWKEAENVVNNWSCPFPGGSTWNAGDLGLIPGSGRSPGEGMAGNSLQYSCLEHHIARGPWRATVQVTKESWGHDLTTKQQQYTETAIKIPTAWELPSEWTSPPTRRVTPSPLNPWDRSSHTALPDFALYIFLSVSFIIFFNKVVNVFPCVL